MSADEPRVAQDARIRSTSQALITPPKPICLVSFILARFWEAGQKKDDDESIGHEGGRKSLGTLQRNPDKDPAKYTSTDVGHTRRAARYILSASLMHAHPLGKTADRVVTQSYCKRHLTQESKLKETETNEEFEKTNSTKSLKVPSTTEI
ncbi:hypothetical protein FRB94_012593 [Tulasnella sp. JGI-2019a]|nr:hypothetical protein FRB93_001444 [Tulasnella sp. JGI-2019a]KAG9009068.1 hypothetical protein FRB94_012593 [Tulasnella sp. JGI-2019a]